MQAAATANCFPALARVMAAPDTGMLTKLVQLVVTNTEMAHILVGYYSVLARCALYDPMFFIGFIDAMGVGVGNAVQPLLATLIDMWVDKVKKWKDGLILAR